MNARFSRSALSLILSFSLFSNSIAFQAIAAPSVGLDSVPPQIQRPSAQVSDMPISLFWKEADSNATNLELAAGTAPSVELIFYPAEACDIQPAVNSSVGPASPFAGEPCGTYFKALYRAGDGSAPEVLAEMDFREFSNKKLNLKRELKEIVGKGAHISAEIGSRALLYVIGPMLIGGGVNYISDKWPNRAIGKLADAAVQMVFEKEDISDQEREAKILGRQYSKTKKPPEPNSGLWANTRDFFSDLGRSAQAKAERLEQREVLRQKYKVFFEDLENFYKASYARHAAYRELRDLAEKELAEHATVVNEKKARSLLKESAEKVGKNFADSELDTMGKGFARKAERLMLNKHLFKRKFGKTSGLSAFVVLAAIGYIGGMEYGTVDRTSGASGQAVERSKPVVSHVSNAILEYTDRLLFNSEYAERSYLFTALGDAHDAATGVDCGLELAVDQKNMQNKLMADVEAAENAASGKSASTEGKKTDRFLLTGAGPSDKCLGADGRSLYDEVLTQDNERVLRVREPRNALNLDFAAQAFRDLPTLRTVRVNAPTTGAFKKSSK